MDLNLKKLLFGNYEQKKYIADYFPLINIVNNQLELKKDETIKIYKKENLFAASNYENTEIQAYYDYFNNYLKNGKKGDGFSMLIKIHKENATFMKNLKNENTLPIFKQYTKNKLSNFKNRNKKFIDTYIGVSSYFFNNSFITLMDRLDYKQMNDTELFSFLFDYFNPSMATQDLNLKYLPPVTKEQLKSDEFSLLQILYHSYIETNNRYFEVGKTKIEVFNIIAPAENIDINKLIKDLSHLKSDINISIKIQKDESEALLASKATFAGSSLLGMSAVNKRISSNIKELLNYLKDQHNSLATANITIFLMNEDEEELKKDKLNFEEWIGVEYIINKFNRVYEYLYAIPGLNVKGNHSIFMPSNYVASLCLPNGYNKTFTTSLFYDKNNIIQPFDYKMKSRKVNNGVIIAPTRSGKSVLLNYILFNKLLKNYNPQTKKFETYGLLIDFGNSYDRLVNSVNDMLPEENKISYKSIGLKNKYNILDLNFGHPIDGNDINNKVNLLLQFFSLVFESFSEKEKVLLSKSLEKMYHQFLFGEYKLKDFETGIVYWDAYVESNYTDVKMFLKAMPTLSSIVGIMSEDKELTSMFSKDVLLDINEKIGIFCNSKEGEIFQETSTDILLADILIVDFEAITQEVGGKLPALILQMLINYKYQEFISERIEGKEKFIFIDEYPQFLKIEPKIAKTVDFLLKTGQKKNLDIFIISQNVKQIDQEFFPNLGTLTLFNLNLPSEIKNLSETISVPEEYFKPIKELQFVKNKFSDLMIMEISDEKMLKSTLRFELSKTDLQLFTKMNLDEIDELKD